LNRDIVLKTACDVFRYQDCAMIVLRVSLALDIPILKSTDYMALVRRAELKLNLIPALCICILKKKI